MMALLGAGRALMAALDRLGRPIPRTHPFGDGSACDGCDTADVFTQRGGGWYCRRCWEEISALAKVMHP